MGFYDFMHAYCVFGLAMLVVYIFGQVLVGR